MADTHQITDFITKLTIIFTCEECGETIHMRVPARSGAAVERSYCCSATYRVTNFSGDVLLERLPDREHETKEAHKQAEYRDPIEI